MFHMTLDFIGAVSCQRPLTRDIWGTQANKGHVGQWSPLALTDGSCVMFLSLFLSHYPISQNLGKMCLALTFVLNHLIS